MAKEGQRETLAEIRMANGGILQLQRFEDRAYYAEGVAGIRLIFAKGPNGDDCFPTREEADRLARALVEVFGLAVAPSSSRHAELLGAVFDERQAEIDRNNVLRLPRPADGQRARAKEKLDAATLRRREAVDAFRTENP